MAVTDALALPRLSDGYASGDLEAAESIFAGITPDGELNKRVAIWCEALSLGEAERAGKATSPS